MVFRDPDFPADASSIGEHGDKNARWFRIHELTGVVDPPKRTKPVLFSVLDADDVKQGQLGDCWLLAAIAAMADFPGHIMDLFNPREYAEDGKYEVRFHDIKEGWVTVTIDDRIPCLPWGPQPCFVQVPEAGDVWVLLLEKAFAKFCGTYALLDGGGATWAYQVLTGITEQLVYMRKGNTWQQWHVSVKDQEREPRRWRTDGMRGTGLTSRMPMTKYDAEEFFALLAYYDQSNCLMTASVRGEVMEGRRKDGLIENHAYSVLEVQKAHGKCMIKLRNPWGGDEWKGAFGDKSKDWDTYPDLAADLQAEAANNGEFWMPYEEFTKIYDGMSVSPGNLSVPKQSRVGGKKMEGLACANCHNVMTRVWCMVDMSSNVHGEWVRFQDGDFCFMCRKAQAGITDFRPELRQIAGIDQFPRYPRLTEPTRPREKEECKYGCYCYRWNPEHFAEYSHPWLGGRSTPKKSTASVSPSKTGGGGGGSSKKSSPAPAVVDVEPYAHEMLNAFKKDDWDLCKDLLRKYPSIVNMRPGGRDWGLIHRAAACGELKYFDPIVSDFGADIELPTGNGMSPLQVAERGGEKCADVADYIRKRLKSTDPPPEPPEDLQRTFLRAARHRNWPVSLDVLAKHPNIINCRPAGEKFYAVHHAAFQGQLMILQTIVENYNADTTVRDGDGRLPIETAKAAGHTACEIYLSPLSCPSGSTFAGRELKRPEEVLEGTSTYAATEDVSDDAEEFTERVVEACLSARKQDWTRLFEVLSSCPEAAAVRPPGRNWAAIHQASRWGNLDVIRRLLEDFGVPPNLLSADGSTPADVAEHHGHKELSSFIRAAQVRKAEDLEASAEETTRAVFKKWDCDGSGFILKDEMRAMMKALMPEAKKGIDALFSVVDVNQDGRISYEEFIAWLYQ